MSTRLSPLARPTRTTSASTARRTARLLAGCAVGAALPIGLLAPATPAAPAPPRALFRPVAAAPPTATRPPVRASRSLARTPLLPRTALRRVDGSSFSGSASWYGPGFEGRRTATGERFHSGELTAAHRTLAFGTRLRVCHAGRCVVVRINDRGPFVRSRVLDLSRGAASGIGLLYSGVGPITATELVWRRVPLAVRVAATHSAFGTWRPVRWGAASGVVHAAVVPGPAASAAPQRPVRPGSPAGGLAASAAALVLVALWRRANGAHQ